MHKQKKQMIFKFLITFIISMLAPLVLITLLLVSHIGKQEFEHITESITEETQSLLPFFEDLSDNAVNIRIVLEKKSCFYDFYIQSYGGANVYIRYELIESATQSGAVEDIMFFSKTTNLLYGAATYSKENYLSFLTPEIQVAFSQALQSENGSWISDYQINHNGIITNQLSYILPFEISDTDKTMQSYLIFHFDSEEIDAQFNSLRYYEGALFYVADGTQTVYTSDSSITTASFEGLQNGDTFTWQGQEYYLSIAQGQSTLTAYTLIPMHAILATSNTYTAIYWLYALISMALGCVVIIFFVRFHYVPIFKLSNSFADLGLNLDLSPKFFQEISTTIQALNTDNTEADRERAKLQRESLLFKLLNIKFPEQNRKELHDICTLSDIHVDRDCFVCVVCSGFKSQVQQTTTILESNKNYDIYEYHYMHSRAMILLFAMDKDATGIVDEVLNSILSRPALGIRACGISTLKADFLDINAAYQEAFLSMNYCFQSEQKILCFSELDAQSSIDTSTILREGTLLKESITEKDIDKTMFSFNLVSASLNTLTDVHILRIHCFELASQCLSNYHALTGAKPLDFEAELSSFLDLNTTEGVSPTHTLREILKAIIYEITELNKTTKVKLNIDVIKTRIQAELLNPNFSIKQLAEEQNSSVSNLSHFFKAKEGQNISDYIAGLKHTLVKQMLCETSNSLHDIAERIGYTHTSNFIKKFKTLEGMTPNQYRAQYKAAAKSVTTTHPAPTTEDIT
ncbi:MAG: AraC family transcriptional regulator [Faecalibacterium sp.]